VVVDTNDDARFGKTLASLQNHTRANLESSQLVEQMRQLSYFRVSRARTRCEMPSSSCTSTRRILVARKGHPVAEKSSCESTRPC
jgi:hypothetical protein